MGEKKVVHAEKASEGGVICPKFDMTSMLIWPQRYLDPISLSYLYAVSGLAFRQVL